MKTTNFKMVRETEKAILFVVGFKFNENAPKIVHGPKGEQDYAPGKEVEMWIPKSVISEDSTIAMWFANKIYKEFGRMSLRDTLYV